MITGQVLESMIDNFRAERAETGDLVNAILDGADTIVMSNETATGNHPVEAFKQVSKCCIEGEKLFENERRF